MSTETGEFHPKDGVYYFTVGDCNSVFDSGCSPASQITTLEYAVRVMTVANSGIVETSATSANGDVANAARVVYGAKSTYGDYPASLLSGVFSGPNETHVFAFTPPADASLVPYHRYRVNFLVQPIGKELGNGSDANVRVRITDASGNVILSSADQANHGHLRDYESQPLDLSAPLIPGRTYYLFVENGDGSGQGYASFYFIRHYVGNLWYGFVEEEDATNTGRNDTYENAEIVYYFTDDLPNRYFIDGNLAGGTDVDWFRLPSSGSTYAYIECYAQRSGSGLRDFKAELYRASGGAPVSLVASATETATQDLFAIGNAPAGQYLLKLSAGSLASGIAGDHYRCSVLFL